MTALRALWAARWMLIVGIALVAVWLLVTQYLDHREEAALVTLPVKAVQTRAAARWQTALVPGCPAVVERLPPAKDRKRIEREFGVSLGNPNSTPETGLAAPRGDDQAEGGGQGAPFAEGVLGPHVPILGLFEVPKAPYGGEALATLPASGELDLTFKLNPAPFLSFRPIWGLGGSVDPTAWPDSWRAYVLVEPLHLRGRWHLRLTGGPEARDGKSDLVLGIGAEFRSR